MANVDLDCSGGIDYSEFIVGTMNKQLLLSPENIKLAFDACDQDHNGCIDLQEIRNFVKAAEVDDAIWSEFIEDAFLSQKDALNFDEAILDYHFKKVGCKDPFQKPK